MGKKMEKTKVLVEKTKDTASKAAKIATAVLGIATILSEAIENKSKSK